MNNIYTNWLQSIKTKTHKQISIFTHKKFLKEPQTLPYGFIEKELIKYNEDTVLTQNNDDNTQLGTSQLQLNLVVPQQDLLQYLIQWQRYRKYWWSSITTTPSLFAINESEDGDERSSTNIVAQFPWGQHTAETLSTYPEINPGVSQLKCSMSLENAIFVLLLDGLNSSREDYLRLHRYMAPYKISFALQTEGTSSNMDALNSLVHLMYLRLKSNEISAYVPNLANSLHQQITENLQLGVSYTAILNDNTLTNGIFQFLNSNTMLKEEVHVGDFDSYAALICKSNIQ